MDELLQLKVKHILDKDMVLFSWMMFSAADMNPICGNVKLQAGEIITAGMVRTLVLFVQVRSHPLRSIHIFYVIFLSLVVNVESLYLI